MVNPHFDREEIISEDIGFQGPHINENINVMDLYPQYTGHETWSPQGEFGQHGEFEGWRSQEDPPSYRSDWQDYPADEFTGIQSNVPSGGGFLKNIYEKFGGDIPGLWGPQMGGLYGGRRTPEEIRQDAINWGQKAGLPNRISFAGESGRDILNPNEMRVNAPSYGDWKSMAQRKMIMDRRYQGEDNPYYPQDLLAKIYTSDMPGMINEGSNWNFMPGGDPLWDEVSPQGEAINTVLEMPIIQQMITEGGFNYEDFMRVIPESLRRELPRDAFQSKSDFMKQQPITVI